MKRILTGLIIATICITNVAYGKTIQEVKDNYSEVESVILEKYKDIDEDAWYAKNLVLLSDMGVIKGYNDGTFKPNNLITRAQYIKMLVSALGYNDIIIGKEYWAKPYIYKAYSLGLLVDEGANPKNFDVPITREEMADITIKALKEDYIDDVADYITEIKDYKNITEDRKYSILKVYYKGIIKGYPDGEFKPNKNANRAEAATIIVRFLDPSERKNQDGVFTQKIIDELKDREIMFQLEGEDVTFGNVTSVEEEEIKKIVTNYFNDIEVNVNYNNVKEDKKDFVKKAQDYYKDAKFWDGSKLIEGEKYASIVIDNIIKNKIISTGKVITNKELMYKKTSKAYVVRGKKVITYTSASSKVLEENHAKLNESVVKYFEVTVLKDERGFSIRNIRQIDL